MLYRTDHIEPSGPFVTFTATGRECKHLNGWYGIIPFWIFRRKIFMCSDCGDALYGKRLKKWQDQKKG
jgi:hypothetical protein